MKKFLLFNFVIVIAVFLASLTFKVSAQQNKLNITLYYGDGCPHCEAASQYLNTIIPTFDETIILYKEKEVYYNKENSREMARIAQEKGIKQIGVPFLLIGDDYLVGYRNDQTSGNEIKQLIQDNLLLTEIQQSTIAGEINPTEQSSESANTVISNETGENNDQDTVTKSKDIDLPIVGKINPVNISLPFLTILIAAIDGFNPCAMWTLLFLISLLLGMKDRKRMWILGTTFIISSALVYFLFLAAWFNFFYFFAYVAWIKIGIGLLALATSIYYLRDFVVNKDGACKVSNNDNKKKVFQKLEYYAKSQKLLFALAGIIGLAFAVNLVELVCSAGLPAIYTNILSLSDLNTWKYYSYLVLYILVFMIDDLFVFFVAMVSLKAVGLESKYARFSHLAGGILLFLIGLILLFKPELLMMG